MDDRLLFMMSKASHVLKLYLKNEFAAAGVRISPAQMGVLFLLRQKDRRMMTELSAALSVDNSAVTGLVDRLEQLGLVKREESPGDRRKYVIAATRAGLEEADRAGRVAARVNASIRDAFSEQEIRVFKKVLDGIYMKFGGGDS